MSGSPIHAGIRFRSGLFGAAAVLSLALGVVQATSEVCPSCTGLIAVVLPWAGTVFYGTLGLVSWKRPDHRLLSWAAGFYLFVHACLTVESVLEARVCPFCVGIALIALGAGILQVVIRPHDLPAAAAALVLGAAAAIPRPFDRIEDEVTRRLWPARILSEAPSFVDRKILQDCGHPVDVRVLLYEDERSCRSCSSVTRRIIPSLANDFPTRICIHSHTLSPVPRGQAMPVLVLVSRSTRMTIIEGLPDYRDLKKLIDAMLAEFASPVGKHP